MARKPSKKKLIELIHQHGGILTDIADACGVTRQSVHKWIKDDPSLKQHIDQSRDLLVDMAKKGLKHHLENNSEKSIHFVLDRLARKEGFGKFIQVQDKSQFEDQLDGKTDEELLDLMNQITGKLTNES